MIRFAAFVAQGTPTPTTFAAYAAKAGAEDAAAARALLSGQRPKRLASAATLLDWVADATHTPAFLIDACLQACPDKAEVAALLLPHAPLLTLLQSEPPTLTEVLGTLTSQTQYLSFARRLPPQARILLNRIAAGTFRTRLTEPAQTSQTPGQCFAILTMIDPSGPEGTFAIPHGNTLIPLTKLRLTLPDTADLLAWARAHTTDRFGPLRQVTPTQVFELTFDATTPNPRRKCGLDLAAPRLIAWVRDRHADQVPTLTAFLASLP